MGVGVVAPGEGALALAGAVAACCATFAFSAYFARRAWARGTPSWAVRRRVGPREWAQREALAAAYRVSAARGWDELIYNHITLAVDGGERGARRFLINPFGLRFDEVTPANLVTIDGANRVLDPGSNDPEKLAVNFAGFVLHSAVHAARPDLACVWHTHYTPLVGALCASKCGLLMACQVRRLN